MTKMNVWSSATGIFGALFLIAATTGAVFQFIWMYLKAFQFGLYGPPYDLVFFILSIAAMAFFGLLLIISIFGSPKVLWIIFAFLGLACALVPPILLATTLAFFPYVFGPWYVLFPMDFIGFWLAAGGSLLAIILGFFIQTD